jgi:hypothetical protein
MADPFADYFAHAVAEAILAQQSLVEMMCEKSLTDPFERGVLLVWSNYPHEFSVGLSEWVPWGEIYEVKP